MFCKILPVSLARKAKCFVKYSPQVWGERGTILIVFHINLEAKSAKSKSFCVLQSILIQTGGYSDTDRGVFSYRPGGILIQTGGYSHTDQGVFSYRPGGIPPHPSFLSRPLGLPSGILLLLDSPFFGKPFPGSFLACHRPSLQEDLGVCWSLFTDN